MGGEESDRSPVIYTLARGRKEPRIYASGNVRAGDALGPFHTDPQRATPTHIYIHTRIANGETPAIFQKKKKKVFVYPSTIYFVRPENTLNISFDKRQIIANVVTVIT